MAKGGRRPGSGRPRGAANKLNREIATRVLAEGKTPLEVMIEAMRRVYEKDGPVAAAPYAEKAAPYMHPKFAAITHSGPDNGPLQIQAALRVEDLTDEQLAAARAFHAASRRTGTGE